MQRLGVHAEMDVAHPETVGAHCSSEGLEGNRLGRIGGAGFVFQLRDDWCQRQELVAIIMRQPVCRCRQVRRISEVCRKILDTRGRQIMCGAQLGEKWMAAVDAFQLVCITRQALGLLRQAEADRSVPFDVGAPVHVVANPAGEAERHRLQFVPAVRPFFAGARKEGGNNPVAGILRMGECGHGSAMLVIERDRLFLAIGSAHWPPFGGCLRHRLRLPGREQEGGMGGEHHVQLRLGPTLREIFEAADIR